MAENKQKNREKVGSQALAANLSSPSTPITSSLNEFLRSTQENLLALQKMGEQTAHLHKQFLDGQDRALQVFQGLLDQQQQLWQGTVPPSTEFQPVRRANDNQQTSHSSNGLGLARRPVEEIQGLKQAPTAAKVNPQSEVVETGARIESYSVSSVQESTNVQTILLDVVSEKTGYPPEMLELDMEMDADLGIDSIKRVEILSVLQERLPEAPVIKAEHLGTLRTLRQVMEFLMDSKVTLAPRPLEIKESKTKPISASLSVETVERNILQAVAEKTGYPTEMLELNMEMDADLGIDSIKRVEILSVLQERMPEAPVIKAEHLGTLRTLRQVAEFLAGPALKTEIQGKQTAVETTSQEPSSGHSHHNGNGSIKPVTRQTQGLFRYILKPEPLSKNRPRLNLSQSGEFWVTNDETGLSQALVSLLAKSGNQARHVTMADWQNQEMPNHLAGLIVCAPLEPLDGSYFDCCLQLIQSAAPALRSASKDEASVLVTVSRLDGTFGSQNWQEGCTSSSGGLAGFTKTASHEWPEVHAKAIDLAFDFGDIRKAAEEILEELHLAGPIEVGIAETGRCTPTIVETAQQQGALAQPLSRGDVVVISGGGRGVTAETAVALAQAFSPTLVLLGRSPEPTAEPDWLMPLHDEVEIKRTLSSRLNGNSSPRIVADQFHHLKANREILHNLHRIRAAGAKVIYCQVDVTDQEAVRTCLAEVQATHGPIRGVIHGAGVLADRLIEDKTVEQFNKVLSTKVAGLQCLLDAVDQDQLKLLVVFSSTTARLGRKGQVDYAVANEILNKQADAFAHRHPACRTLAINWGPWDGGMVNSSLKGLFEKEGVALIAPSAGAEFLVHEIQQPLGSPVEVIALGGPLPTGKQAPAALKENGISVLERQVSVGLCPVLASHVIEGQAVLPMALIAEWLAHAALHGHPGMMFHGFDDLRLFKGIRLTGDQTLLLAFRAGKAIRKGPFLTVPMEMTSKDGHGREVLHAGADILLTISLPAAKKVEQEPLATPFWKSLDEVYGEILFHGPALQGIRQIEGFSEAGIIARVATAPAPAKWMHNPLRNTWILDPMALDCAFQLMVLWTHENRNAGSLPCFAESYRQYQRTFPKDGVRVLITITHTSNNRALADISFVDDQANLLATLTGYECVFDPSLDKAFRRNHLGRQVLPST